MVKIKHKYSRKQTDLVRDWGFPKVPITLKIGNKKKVE